jgi:hypothetical protein
VRFVKGDERLESMANFGTDYFDYFDELLESILAS